MYPPAKIGASTGQGITSAQTQVEGLFFLPCTEARVPSLPAQGLCDGVRDPFLACENVQRRRSVHFGPSVEAGGHVGEPDHNANFCGHCP